EGENSVHGAHCPVRHRARRAAARRGTPGGPLSPGPSAAGLAPPVPEERRGAPAPPAADDPAGFPSPPLLPCSAAPHPAAAEPRAAAILPPLLPGRRVPGRRAFPPGAGRGGEPEPGAGTPRRRDPASGGSGVRGRGRGPDRDAGPEVGGEGKDRGRRPGAACTRTEWGIRPARSTGVRTARVGSEQTTGPGLEGEERK